VGKSTLLKALIECLRSRGERVGVVAVDATSALSGGALLGDRLRLSSLQTDPEVFIRSLGSRGSLGGIAPAAAPVARLLEAVGYHRVLMETVGVGQTGHDVIGLADTVVVLFSPEGGDGLQMLKAGLLEVGDVFAVNKSDRPGAEQMLNEVRLSLELAAPSAAELLHHGGRVALPQEPQPKKADAAAGWQPPVIRLVARSGEGVAELDSVIQEHRDWLSALPPEHPRRRLRCARELVFNARSRLDQVLELRLGGTVAELAEAVSAGRLPPWEAAERLRKVLLEHL
jgi:LAO/AO transport system kinase